MFVFRPDCSHTTVTAFRAVAPQAQPATRRVNPGLRGGQPQCRQLGASRQPVGGLHNCLGQKIKQRKRTLNEQFCPDTGLHIYIENAEQRTTTTSAEAIAEVVHRRDPGAMRDTVERGISVVERRTRNQVRPGLNPPLLPFGRLGIFLLSIDAPVDSAVNEYLAIDSGGNVSDLVVARNCCMARMLPGEAENGVGMNRSVREGKKCKAL